MAGGAVGGIQLLVARVEEDDRLGYGCWGMNMGGDGDGDMRKYLSQWLEEWVGPWVEYTVVGTSEG